MYAVRALPRPLAGVAALTLALLVAVPLMGAKGGNSAAAKACQKSGSTSLATSEDPSTAFPDQGACVSYAARGGTLADLVVVHGSVQFVWFEDDAGCKILFDANIPDGVVSEIRVVLSNSDFRAATNTAWKYPAFAALPVTPGSIMTSASGWIYEPPGQFPVAIDPEPCGPGSTAD